MNVAMFSDVEQINTMEVNEAPLSILLAAAQEESAAKSENIKFGIRQRMRSGKAVLNHTRFLGYTKDEDGRLVVVLEEADIVEEKNIRYKEKYIDRTDKTYFIKNKISFSSKRKWGSISFIGKGTVFVGAPERILGTLPEMNWSMEEDW